MTDNQTRTVIDAFFARFGAGDLAGVLDLHAAELDHQVQGASIVPWTGQRTTKAEVEQFFDIVVGATVPQRFEVSSILVAGSDAVALGEFAFEVKSTGKTFASKFALRFTVADDKIVRYEMFEDSHAIAEAFLA